MHRRDMIKGLFVTSIPAAAAGAAALASGAGDTLRTKGETTLQTVKSQLDRLRDRVDQNEKRTRRLTKAAITLAALSLGIDVSAFL